MGGGCQVTPRLLRQRDMHGNTPRAKRLSHIASAANRNMLPASRQARPAWRCRRRRQHEPGCELERRDWRPTARDGAACRQPPPAPRALRRWLHLQHRQRLPAGAAALRQPPTAARACHARDARVEATHPRRRLLWISAQRCPLRGGARNVATRLLLGSATRRLRRAAPTTLGRLWRARRTRRLLPTADVPLRLCRSLHLGRAEM